MKTTPLTRITLTFRSASDVPANPSQASAIGRQLRAMHQADFLIHAVLGDGKYDCAISPKLLDQLATDATIRCAHGSVSV